MKLNLTELSKAVVAVAGIASEHAAMKSDMIEAQAAVDALTASLVAAQTSPAGAVGLAAVAEAMSTSTFVPIPPPAEAEDVLANLK